jgi:hypothetical protein
MLQRFRALFIALAVAVQHDSRTLSLDEHAFIEGGSEPERLRLLLARDGPLHCHKQQCGVICSNDKFSGERLCMPSIQCDSSPACTSKVNNRFFDKPLSWNWNGGKLAVLVFGQTARSPERQGTTLCTKAAQDAQLAAIATQRSTLESLSSKSQGLTVDLFVASNDCGSKVEKKKQKQKKKKKKKTLEEEEESAWAKVVKDSYGQLLRASAIANCDEENNPATRCFLRRALDLMRNYQNSHRAVRYDSVLLLRPDLFFKGDQGQILVHDLLATKGASAWPFKCEPTAWREWKCVSDTVFSIPGNQFPTFASTCLGTDGCYAELGPYANITLTEYTVMKRGAPSAGSFGAPDYLRYSGHSCYRCMLKLMQTWTPEAQAKGPRVKGSRSKRTPIIIRDEERLVNARDIRRGGRNPYYYFASA